ncbi:MAG: T9SS type A sorting domain-containing protein [Bacteroidetes bacterium]|nr:T9SS type A sorting domain-containing protein [Bacteroidota bacterium]
MKRDIIPLFLLFFASEFDGQSQNSWTQKADFGGTARYGAVAFSIGDKGYIGTGSDGISGGNSFWEYDPTDNTWTQKADFAGIPRREAVGFAIDSFGYIGTGNSNPPMKDFWQFNPLTNSWTQKTDFPGTGRRYAMGFSIGSKGYLGFGDSGFSGYKKDFWEYDPATDTWTEKAQIGGKGRAATAGFSIGNKGYVGPGGSVASDGGAARDFWEYDPVTNVWTQKTTFPGPGRWSAVGFSIAGKGYVGTGDIELNDFELASLKDFWEYDPVSDTWSQKADLGGSARYRAAGFAIGNKGYIGTGAYYDSICVCDYFFSDFWEYTPDCEVPSGLTTTNIKSNSAKVNWNTVATAQTYSVRYRKTGTAPWTKTSTQSNFKKLAGLQPNTQYDWSVKTVCDAASNVSSDWSTPQNFTTKPMRLEDEDEADTAPEVFPNPFSSSYAVSFSLLKNSPVVIGIFDLAGKRIQTLFNASLESGEHDISFDGAELNTGIYLLQLKTNEKTEVLKMVKE